MDLVQQIVAFHMKVYLLGCLIKQPDFVVAFF